MAYNFDLIVIGGGSGGVRAARMAAAKGAKVALIEGDRLGGTCVIRGCIPKKLLSFAAHGFEEVQQLAGYGYSIAQPRFDWTALIAAKDAEIDRLEGVYGTLLDKAGVTVFAGWAQFKNSQEVQVGGRTLSAERFLIATGGRAALPYIAGREHFITSNDAFDLPDLPQRIAIYGGGYIAVEFAGIFSGLGADTTLIYRGDKPLRSFDEAVRCHFLSALRKKPLTLAMNRSLVKIEGGATGGKVLTFDDGSTQEVDLVLAATGRSPNSSGLGLSAAGVALGPKGAIQVDGLSQTSQPHIYAVGDVTNRLALTPVAIHEAMAFVDTVYGDTPRGLAYDCIATAVFSNPEVCTVGLTQEEAVAAYPRGRSYTSRFRALRHVLPHIEEQTFMKLLVEAEGDRVIGLHVVGLHAAEMVQGFAVAMKAGATKAQFDATVGIHPSSAEELVTLREPTETWG